MQAAASAQIDSGMPIERYDYAVTLAASGAGIVLNLEPADVERKLAAAYRFAHLTSDVDELLAGVGRQEIARELLRPVRMSIDLPIPAQKPLYEAHGEQRVAAGRYRNVLRYQQHFVPFVRALAAAVTDRHTREQPRQAAIR